MGARSVAPFDGTLQLLKTQVPNAALGCGTRFNYRQSSPPHRIRDRGAASPAGALRWRHLMARYKCKKQRGRAALDAAPTTTKALDPGSSPG